MVYYLTIFIWGAQMTSISADIIIIEDNSYDAELAIKSLLKNIISNNILILDDGEKAMDYFLCKNEYSNRNIEDKPKLILLDLKLPKIDGLEVLKELKSNERLKNIPVVILSSSREEQDIINCYKSGANSYIVKPVDFHEIFRRIDIIGKLLVIIERGAKIIKGHS